MIKKRNIVILLTAIILLQLGFITYMFAFQKEGFHSDDNWSYGFANADEGGWIYHDDSGKSRNFNKWTDGKVLWIISRFKKENNLILVQWREICQMNGILPCII